MRSVSDRVSALGSLEVWRPAVAVVDPRAPAGEARRFGAAIATRPESERVPVVLVAKGPNLLKPTTIVPEHAASDTLSCGSRRLHFRENHRVSGARTRVVRRDGVRSGG